MFSSVIVESDEFLAMPISSQALYFHLAMRADDDGFVQPKSTMKLTNVNDDDLKVLISKRFILPFDTGVVVIKHWLIHNMIRGDRYKPTRFQEEKKSLFVKENKAYTEKEQLWQPNGNQMATQYRIGKVSIGKNTDVSFSKKEKPKPETILPEWLDKALWLEWEAHRREKGKKLTPTTIKRQLSFLEANRGQYRAIIEKSILNGWTGLFPIEKKDIRDSDKARAYEKMQQEKEEERERQENLKNNENIAKVYRDLGALGDKMRG